MKLLSYYAPYETGSTVTLETIPALNTFKGVLQPAIYLLLPHFIFSTLRIIRPSLLHFLLLVHLPVVSGRRDLELQLDLPQ